MRAMHLGDGIIIFVIALILFGPKKLPEMARQVAKLMAEFRRASNEFKSQIDEELRSAEQADRQKQISATAATQNVMESGTGSMAAPTILPPSVGVAVSQQTYSEPPAYGEPPNRSEFYETHGAGETEAVAQGAGDANATVLPEATSGSGEASGGGIAEPPVEDATSFPKNPFDAYVTESNPTFGALGNGEVSAEAATPASPAQEAVRVPAEFAPDRPTDGPVDALVEGSASENAQASIHHV